eukprot:jgi/Undpi1/299/HiC_scaffold_1.g00295.m1
MSLPSLEHFNFREYEHFYEPAEDTYLLIDALQADAGILRHQVRPLLCLEIGPGSGVVTAALCALLSEGGGGSGEGGEGGEGEAPRPQPLYMAAEINPRAAEACLRTAKANKVEPFEVVCCDLAACMRGRLKGLVDVLLFNPPYVPTPPEEVGSKDIAAAWAGGLRGREVIDRFLPAVKELLSPRGCFYMVAVEDNDPAQIVQAMRDQGVQAEAYSSYALAPCLSTRHRFVRMPVFMGRGASTSRWSIGWRHEFSVNTAICNRCFMEWYHSPRRPLEDEGVFRGTVSYLATATAEEGLVARLQADVEKGEKRGAVGSIVANMQQCIDDGNYKIQEPKTRLADEIKLKHEQDTSDDSAVRRAAKILRAYVEKYGMQSSEAVEA